MAHSQPCDWRQPSPRGETGTQRLSPGCLVLQWHTPDGQQPLTGTMWTLACSAREHPPGRAQSPAARHLLPPPSHLHKGNTEGARTHLTQKSSRDHVDPKQSRPGSAFHPTRSHIWEATQRGDTAQREPGEPAELKDQGSSCLFTRPLVRTAVLGVKRAHWGRISLDLLCFLSSFPQHLLLVPVRGRIKSKVDLVSSTMQPFILTCLVSHGVWPKLQRQPQL